MVRPPAPASSSTNSYRTSASSSTNGISLPAGMEEDTDDDLLDYKPSPAHDGMEINVIYLSSTNYSLLEEKEVSQLALGPQDAIFKKPAESGDHLKPLYICGHLHDTPVAHTLVDGGTAVNVMPYSTFKKLERTNAKLIKTNMTIMGISGDVPIGPKGVASMELTVGARRSLLQFSSRIYKVTTTLSLAAIGFIQTIVFLLLCINS
jgi:hypothetical protein